MEGENVIDTTVGRYKHVIHNINANECKQWLNSQITKSLIDILDMCGILVALQFEQYEDGEDNAVLHTMVPFDIKTAMVEKQRCRNNKK